MPSFHWRRLGRAAAVAMAAIVIAIAAASAAQCLFDPALYDIAAIGAPDHLRLLLANALPVACFGLALFALSGRPLFAAALTLTLLAALHAANSIKLLQLGLPLLPADLHFLRGGHGEAGLLFRYVAPSRFVVPALALALAFVAAWREWRRPAHASLRIATGIVAIAIGASLLQGATPWRALYDRSALRFEPWSPAKTEAHAGLLPTLLLFRWELAPGPRPPADRAAALRLLSERAALLRDRMQAGAAAEMPDIVVVQSESFFDPERLRGMPDGTLPNFRALADTALSGNLTVPTFGGGTVRTEFEVLTGIALSFLPGIEYPYFELVDRPLPSLPRNLARSGYRTLAIHPNDPGFWNRGRALQQIGIGRFVAGADFHDAPKAGLFVADAALTDRILAELKDDGPPQFVFAISMEAHGPYEWRGNLDAARRAAIAVPAGLNEYEDRTLRNYLYHLQDADHELGRLAAALTTRTRPTLLLFYGDHLPGLQATYAATGFVDGRPARAQPTPWLLLDNTSMTPARDDLYAWQLPSRLLAAAGVREDAYFALLDTLHDAIGAMTDADLAFSDALGEIVQLRLANEFDALAAQTLDADDADHDATPDELEATN